MECIKCGRGLKLHRSRTNSKREVWGCPAAGCDHREDFPLWGPARLEDAEAVVNTYTDRKAQDVWEYDDKLRKGREAA